MASRTKHDFAAGLQRVYGYARVSTDRQSSEGVSLAEQEHRIRARCAENGWTLEHVYVDAGVSGSTPLGKRPQGARLLAMLRPGDVMIAAKMDRVFRSASDALVTIEGFKLRKIGLWLLDLGGDVSGDGISKLICGILSNVAEFERDLCAERIRDAKRNLRRCNRHQGGKRPFVGRGKARDLIPDPAEQAAQAEIIELRQAGRSLVAIRDALRAQSFAICNQTVANIIERQQREFVAEAAE